MNINAETSTLKHLGKIIADYSPEATTEKIDLLKACSGLKFQKTSEIIAYHNLLLFLCAYSENKTVFTLAEKEMERLCDRVVHLPEAKKERLSRSGIAFTETQGTFSFELMNWLMSIFRDDMSIHSFDETGEHPKEILKYCLNEMEFELIGDEELSKLKWLEKVSGLKSKKHILRWLLERVEEMELGTSLKEHLFESLKLYITIHTLNPQFSRSFESFSVKRHHFHPEGLLKKFNEQELIHKKLPPETRYMLLQKTGILESARIALALLNRETDPITYGTPEGVKVFDLEHGLMIALFSINPDLRLPLESYIGFMMYKNGYPMAYGGAWLFGKRSLIGINIFEAFRGGESAFVFAQLLRTYKQAFGAEQFEVEPYQFGKNNPEGLKSGAFWFYHRFGFRPLDETLFQLSETEHQKIIDKKTYRTPIEILKQFTKSNLGVNFGKDKTSIKPLQISHFITYSIAKNFRGNRQLAFKWSQAVLKTELGVTYSYLSKEEQFGFTKLSVFVAFCFNLKKITKTDKKTLIKLIKEKGSSEFNYLLTYHKFPFEKYYVKELLEFKVK